MLACCRAFVFTVEKLFWFAALHVGVCAYSYAQQKYFNGKRFSTFEAFMVAAFVFISFILRGFVVLCSVLYCLSVVFDKFLIVAFFVTI